MVAELGEDVDRSLHDPNALVQYLENRELASFAEGV